MGAVTYFKNPLTPEEVDAVNKWHWPITYDCRLDLFADVECVNDEMLAFRTKKFKYTFNYALNTYKKYKANDWQSDKTKWIINVIANIGKIDKDCLPKNVLPIIPIAIRYTESTTEDEMKLLEEKCYTMLDIYVESTKHLA